MDPETTERQNQTDKELHDTRRSAAVMTLAARMLYDSWVLRQRRALLKWLLVSGVAIGCIWVVLQLKDIITPFLIAFFAAALLDPVVNNMQLAGQKHGSRPIKRGRAVATLFGLIFAVFSLIIILAARYAIPQMIQLAEKAPEHVSAVKDFGSGFYDHNQKAFAVAGFKSNPFIDSTLLSTSAVSSVLESLKGAVLGVAGQILWVVIIPLSLFYFLMDFQTIRSRAIALLPLKFRHNVDTMSREVVEIFGAYFRGLAKVCVGYGMSAGCIFLMLGLNYAAFMGLAAGMLYAVPYVGPLVAMVSAGMIALSMGKGIIYAGFSVILFLMMHITFDYIITPKVVGGSVGLHPIVNVFALMAGATLFGIWGMLLAVPVAASIQMALVYFYPRLANREPIDSAPDVAPEPTNKFLPNHDETIVHSSA